MDVRQPEEGHPARIALIEDHVTVRQALAFVLDREPGLKVVAQAGSLAEARRLSVDFDVAIVDLGLPDGGGTEVIRELRKINPQGMVLVLTALSDRAQHARAVEAGAAAVLHKTTPLEEVPRAAKRLLAGEALISTDEVIELLRLRGQRTREGLPAADRRSATHPSEKEILQALADGLSDAEIARRLHISYETERNHITNIFVKLGVDSRLQALLFAVRYDIAEVR